MNQDCAGADHSCWENMVRESGMCGADEYPKDICSDDARTLSRLGTNVLQLASAMAKLVSMAETFDEKIDRVSITYPIAKMFSGQKVEYPQFFVSLFENHAPEWRKWSCSSFLSRRLENPKYTVQLMHWNGAHNCPFKLTKKYKGFSYGSCDIYATADDGTALFFNTLSIHLIAVHGFFQGYRLCSGELNVWRVDPEAAYNFLKPIINTIPINGDRELLAKFIT